MPIAGIVRGGEINQRQREIERTIQGVGNELRT